MGQDAAVFHSPEWHWLLSDIQWKFLAESWGVGNASGDVSAGAGRSPASAPERTLPEGEHMYILHRDDLKLLSVLARAQTTVLQYELEQDPRIGLSRRTICERLKRLRDAGLTYRPNGERGGEAITNAGWARLTGTVGEAAH